MNELTQEQLKELLHYSPETGTFTWRIAGAGRRKSLIAGGYSRHGHIKVNIHGKFYQAHRLAFLYMEGEFPPEQVDHINHVRDDNRWQNLRAATNQENQRNASVRCDSTSGHTGVYWHKTLKKWVSHIKVDGKQIILGYFAVKPDAAHERKKADIKYKFHQNHGG